MAMTNTDKNIKRRQYVNQKYSEALAIRTKAGKKTNNKLKSRLLSKLWKEAKREIR